MEILGMPWYYFIIYAGIGALILWIFDKFKIIKQRNWLCDVSDGERDFNFSPKYDLEAGVRESIEWYRKAGWL